MIVILRLQDVFLEPLLKIRLIRKFEPAMKPQVYEDGGIVNI